jgi:hypothetical protein
MTHVWVRARLKHALPMLMIALGGVLAVVALAIGNKLVLGASLSIGVIAFILVMSGRLLVMEKKLGVMRKSLRSIDKNIRRARGELRGLRRAANSSVTASWLGRTRHTRINAALPLVLIAQIQRSGGTLLSQLFDGHPEVLAFPHELKWGEGGNKYRWPQIDPGREGPMIIAQRLVAPNLKDAIDFNLFGYMKEGARHDGLDGRDQLLGSPFHWSEWVYFETFLESSQLLPPVKSRRQCFDLFMSAYFSAFLSQRGREGSKKFVTAFTPRVNFIQSYPENRAFFEDYPDGLMISICRHPVDWYASASRHSAHYAKLDQAMAEWRESAESAMELKKRYPSQVFLVSFASLVADTSGVMKRLAERLGLGWDPILVVPTFNGMSTESNSSFAPFAGIDALTVGRPGALVPELCAQIEKENLVVYERFLRNSD